MVQIAWTIPRTWVSGEIVTAANMNTHVRDNLLAISGAWVTFTSTWSGTIGNGTKTDFYTRIGRTIHFRTQIIWGSTTSHPGSAQTLTVPVTPTGFYGGGCPMGIASVFDVSAAAAVGNAILVSQGGSTYAMQAPGGTAYWLNSTPMSWATGDLLYVTGTYEANTD